jgi:hypothetical protein
VAHVCTDDFIEAWEARGCAESFGRAQVEGMARGLLTILEARGLTFSEQTRRRITDCTDPEQLLTWVHRAATARAIDDVLTD